MFPGFLANCLSDQAIKNTVAVYCLALDSKTFTLLEDVFTHDVDAKYPFPGGEMKGVEAVAKKIQERFVHSAFHVCHL